MHYHESAILRTFPTRLRSSLAVRMRPLMNPPAADATADAAVAATVSNRSREEVSADGWSPSSST